MKFKYRALGLSVVFMFVLQACGASSQSGQASTPTKLDSQDVAQENAQAASQEKLKTNSAAIALTVYKSPTCGCCGDWVKHIQEAGFLVETIEQENMAAIKDRFGIPDNARSCHTAVSASGAVFEGHVPAKEIKQYLAQAHDEQSSGLTVPGMPVGSPGMEVEDKFMPYTVFELSKTGGEKPYASFETYESQF